MRSRRISARYPALISVEEAAEVGADDSPEGEEGEEEEEDTEADPKVGVAVGIQTG